MAVYFVPSIAPIDYPLLYELCEGRLPATFEEWLLAEELARRELVAEGHHVIGIAVAPGDLRAHCRSLNCRADAAAMNLYVMNAGRTTYPDYTEVRSSTVIAEDLRAQRVAAGQPAIIETPVLVGTVPAARRRRFFGWFRRRPALAVRAA
jgi:hypothetical protein